MDGVVDRDNEKELGREKLDELKSRIENLEFLIKNRQKDEPAR